MEALSLMPEGTVCPVCQKTAKSVVTLTEEVEINHMIICSVSGFKAPCGHTFKDVVISMKDYKLTAELVDPFSFRQEPT